MDQMISLNTMDLDWEVLVRMVERTKRPVWLEIEGTVQGVLLPAKDAQRLMGHYIAGHIDTSLTQRTEGTYEEREG